MLRELLSLTSSSIAEMITFSFKEGLNSKSFCLRIFLKIEAEGIANSKVMLSNAAEMNLADQDFDLVFAFGFARPIGGMEAIWPEIYRLLKPSGVLSVEGRLHPPSDFFQPVKRQGRISQFSKVG